MNIRLAQDCDRERWDAYVLRARHSSCYHLFVWKEIIEKSFGHRTCYFIAEDDSGNVTGVLPLALMKSLLFGKFLVSLPFFNYGGICADGEETRYLLFRRAVDLCRRERAEHIELRQSAPIPGMPVKTAKVSMRLALPAKAEVLWESLGGKLRSQIRRPSKEGMYAILGKEEELESFYTVFAGNMRDLGTPVYSRSFFENILQAFPASWICTVYTADRKPAASGMLIGFKDMLEIPWASSLKCHNRHSPNMLLYWRSLAFACEEGYGFFDFGRSTPGGNTFRFKEQWGARPLQLYWNYWMRKGTTLPELNPNNPRYRAAISLWKKLPLNVTKLLGPSIVKNLP
ncbi:MAG: hypothetical protein A2010_12860 [Nitrospirae bacterium GWD2_57_9]|nr:MAG: hypothetical protein A2010_12860 [Nitrospirae bacterium GWD2_57_9]OGW46607.1 MAG: hypothetical protein A2078_06880 [Nitrospirae bacterium GWC2_57_9]